MIKINYEGAWKDLKEDIGEIWTEGKTIAIQVKDKMSYLEQKHTKEYKEHRAGYGEKPTTERPKPKPRPLKGA